MTYEDWKQSWRQSPYGERLGQAFVNDFMKGSSPEIRKLYFTDDYFQADSLIVQWLVDNCHYPNVPEKINEHA